MRARLTEAGVAFEELGGVVPNPRLSLVREGIALCRKHTAGRRSSRSAAAASSTRPRRSPSACRTPATCGTSTPGRPTAKEMLPVGVVLTIPAAGSESSNGSVITNEEGWYKKDAGAECMRPRFAIMDPVLTFTLPAVPDRLRRGRHHGARHGALLHPGEGGGLHRPPVRGHAADHRPQRAASPSRRPDDYDARAEIMWAGTVAHNDLLGTGPRRRLGHAHDRARGERHLRRGPRRGPRGALPGLDDAT